MGFNGICTFPSPPQQALNIMEQRHSGSARVPARAAIAAVSRNCEGTTLHWGGAGGWV